MAYSLVYVDDISIFLKDRDLELLYKEMHDSYINIEYITPRYIKDNIRIVLCPRCYSSESLYFKIGNTVMSDRFQCLPCAAALGESGYYLDYHDMIIKKIYPKWRWRRGAV